MSPVIEDYRFGEILVDGKTYLKDLIITPEEVLSDWWRRDGHLLALSDLQPVLNNPPQVLVVGQGAEGRMRISRDVHDHLQSLDIEIVSLPTAEACARYNDLRTKRRVCAALHLTC